MLMLQTLLLINLFFFFFMAVVQLKLISLNLIQNLI